MAMQARDRDDRRRGERHPINPEFVSQGANLTYVSNLSEYGVFVNTRVRLPVGTAVDLRFTVMLDDPVVIHGHGRVVHHQDEPRGMGVSFNNLAAVMQLRVIDAINWYRARAGAGTEQAFRTRELSPDELAQIDEEDEADDASTSLSSSDMVAESGAYAGLNASIEELAPAAIEAAKAAAAAAARRNQQASASVSASASTARSPAPPARPGPAAPTPQRPPLKDDEYEDF